MVNTLNSKSSENLMAKQLLELSNVIIFGSLVIHGVWDGHGLLCKTSGNLMRMKSTDKYNR
jgi:hypothetical protein